MYLRRHRVNVDGIFIQAYEHSANGDAILFLHPGMFAGAASWHAVVPNFQSDYRVITMDLRGHGESDQPEGLYTFEVMARDIAAVLDHLDITSCHVVGNSLGSEVGLYFVANYPERVKSFTTVDGVMIRFLGPDGEREGTKDEVVAEFLQRTVPEYESRDAYIRVIRDNWTPWSDVKQAFVERMPMRSLENGAVTDRARPDVVAQEIGAVCDLDMEAMFRRVRCPVLFLPAEREDKLEQKLRFVENVGRKLPFCETVVVPDSEHLMELEQPLELSREILSFLATVQREPSGVHRSPAQ